MTRKIRGDQREAGSLCWTPKRRLCNVAIDKVFKKFIELKERQIRLKTDFCFLIVYYLKPT